MLAVVRDEDVVADEGAELGPHLGKRSRIPHIRIGVAVHLGGAGRDRAVGLHQRMKPVHDVAAHHAHRPNLHNLANLHVLVGRLQVERDVAGEGIEDVEGVEVLEGLEQREREPVWAAILCPDHNLPNLPNLPPRSGGGRHMPHPCGGEHPAQCDLQPPLRLDHDVPLARDRAGEPRGEPHRLGAIGGIRELVVPLLQRVPVRPDALREDLIDERRQRAMRAGQGAEVLHLEHEPPQLLRVGVLRRPPPGERADGREEIGLQGERG